MKRNSLWLKIPSLPVLILCIVCVLTISSSPLFVTNPWDDSNAMLTMGRSVLHGMVPYQDIIDQRGPFLYAIFTIGAFINQTSFTGVFVLQVINVLIIYHLSYKIVKDLTGIVAVTRWLALFGPFALLATSSFSLSGSPEEFAFTSVLYLLYVVNHNHHNIVIIDLKTFFFLGLNLSLIFWNKYSMVGAFCFFFIWVAGTFIYQKKFIRLLKVTLISLVGFFSFSCLVLGYFFYHHAIQEMIQVYFVQNMTSYGKTDQSTLMQIWKIFALVAKEIRGHYLVVLVIVVGWFKSLYDKKENIVLEIFIFLGTIIFVALQHWVINYYNLIWMPFFAIALIRILSFESSRLIDDGRSDIAVSFIITTAIIVLPFVNNQDLNRLIINGESQAISGEQYRAQPLFAKIMREKSNGKGKPSILMINSLDKGFFLASQTLPKTIYWHRLNMSYQQLPQMYQSFENDMRGKKVDYVIVKLNYKPANKQKLAYQQISDAVDQHLRQPLLENYKIKAITKNSNSEFFILLHKNN